MINEAATSSTCNMTLRTGLTLPPAGRSGLSSCSCIIVDPEARRQEGDRGEDRDDHEQHPGQRRGVAHVEKTEGLAVDVEGVEQCRVQRAAGGLRHHEGGRERLEGIDHRYDKVEEDDR